MRYVAINQLDEHSDPIVDQWIIVDELSGIRYGPYALGECASILDQLEAAAEVQL